MRWLPVRVAALMLAAAAASASVDDVQPRALVVGDASDLDLTGLRALIEQVAPVGEVTSSSAPVHALTLSGAVEVALENNLDLQIALRQRDATAREVPATRAKFHPTPGINYGVEQTYTLDRVSRNSAGKLEPPKADEKSTAHLAEAFVRQEIPTGASLTVASDLVHEEVAGGELDDGGLSLELRQPLMRGGRVEVARREILDAEYDLDFEQASLDAEILRITRDTKVAYYNSILTARLIDVTRAAVERDEELIEASEALFNAARASKRDVVSAKVRLSGDQARLSNRIADHDQALLELRDVLGLPLSDRVVPAESLLPFQPVAFEADGWVGRALEARPEIRAVSALLDQAELASRIAGNDVLPKLDLLGIYRRFDTGADVSRAFRLDSEHWGAGVEFEIPFGNVAARERFKQAEIVQARLERELVRQQREIEREVRSEVIELRSNLDAIHYQADKVEQTREKLSVALARYRLGVANNLDITDAQEDLLDAETDLITAVFDYTNGLARLEASIAGPL